MTFRQTSSTIQSITLIDTDCRIAVVAHDAGSANVIFAHLGGHDPRLLNAFCQGPAKEIWRTNLPTTCLRANLEDVFRGAEILISGTSWASDLEHRARLLGIEKGMHTIAVVDHWTNYKSRFYWDGLYCLPNEIWVSDPIAYAIALREFPNTTIKQIENLYRQASILRIKVIIPSNDAIYLLEPIREDWGQEVPGEFQALEYLIQRLGEINFKGTIQLRPHPSEKRSKYMALVNQNEYLSIDKQLSMPEAVGKAKLVFGVQTEALITAHLAGKISISTLPPWAPPILIPLPPERELRNISNPDLISLVNQSKVAPPH